jgi:hypothetical protein
MEAALRAVPIAVVTFLGYPGAEYENVNRQ